MFAGGKGDVRQAFPEYVELLGALPPPFVSVGRTDAYVDNRSGGELKAFHYVSSITYRCTVVSGVSNRKPSSIAADISS